MIGKDLKWLYSLEGRGIQPGLERCGRIMEELGHPERKFKSIHIAGTNGKGSVAAMLDSVLRQTGLKVGLYTSPHLYTFHERVRVDGKQLDDATLTTLIQNMKKTCRAAGIEPTFFEFTTALAFQYFAQQDVDIAVVEVGMGGRLDATNVIHPLVGVITNIGLDHTQFLGTTHAQIAKEKGGIIKEQVPMVIGTTSKEVLEVFSEIAAKKHAPVFVAPNMYQQKSHEYKLPLLGDHQRENLATVLTTIDVLQKLGYDITEQHIKTGIETVRWEGRMEVVSQNPLIIVDGAHNTEGMAALAAFVQSLPRKDVLVFALKEEKKAKDFAELVSLFDHVIVTEGVYRPQPAHILVDAIREFHSHVTAMPNVKIAIEKAKRMAGESGTVVIAGSLYMIGSALAVVKHTHALEDIISIP